MSSDNAAERHPANLISAPSARVAKIELRQDNSKAPNIRSLGPYGDEKGTSQDGVSVSESLSARVSADCETSLTSCLNSTAGFGKSELSPRTIWSLSCGGTYPNHRPSQSKGSLNEPGQSPLGRVKSISCENLRSNDRREQLSLTQDGHYPETTYRTHGRERSKDHIKVPSIVRQHIFNDESGRIGGIRNTTDRTKSPLEYKSGGEKISKTGDVYPISSETKSIVCKAELDHKESVVMKASRMEYDVLTKKLNINIEPDPYNCIGDTKKGFRCTLKIAKSNRIKARQVLERLTTIDLSNDQKVFLELLETLVSLVLCKRFHLASDAKKVLYAWKKSLPFSDQEINNSCFLETSLSPKSPGAQTSELNHDDQCKAEKREHPSDILFEFGFGRAGSAVIRKFVPYKTRTKTCVYKMVTRDLTPREEKSGSIYIYWFPGNFGHLKIGITTRKVEERLKQWEKQCGHKTYLEYPKSQNERQPVPHVYRVEALVHAELGINRKIEVRCEGCGKNHVEWFEKSLPDVIASVQKWSAWIRKEPYVEEKITVWDAQENCNIIKSVWKLKGEYKKDLQALIKAAPAIPSPSSPPVSQKPKMRRPSSRSSGSLDHLRSEQSRRSPRRSERLQKPSLVHEEWSPPTFSKGFLSTT